jgi:hypothetical protein
VPCFVRQQKSSPRRLRPPSRFRGDNHLFLDISSVSSLSSQRSLQRARTVQVKIIPVSINRRQPALLAQLFRQEPREPARALARSTIYCPLHRRIGHHRLGLSVGVAPRVNEIELWMVGVTRGVRNDRSQGSQGVSPRLASECRDPARCDSKIRHSTALSSQCSLQRFTPRLVATRYALGKPVMTSTDSSFGKTWSVQEVQHLSTAHFLLPPPRATSSRYGRGL